jgi:hypothetical protein
MTQQQHQHQQWGRLEGGARFLPAAAVEGKEEEEEEEEEEAAAAGAGGKRRGGRGKKDAWTIDEVEVRFFVLFGLLWGRWWWWWW